MAKKPNFHDPEELELPTIPNYSPDQRIVLGWITQHDRIFFLAIKLGLLAAVLLVSNIYLGTRLANQNVHQEWFEFESGYLVAFDESGELTVDGVTYRPTMLRGMLTNYVDSRMGYDFRQIERIDEALRYLTNEAAQEEQARIRSSDLVNRIINTRSVYQTLPSMDEMTVSALGNGRFRVNIPGTARVNNLDYPDPRQPFDLRFNLEFIVESTSQTEANPYGYVISDPPRDILM